MCSSGQEGPALASGPGVHEYFKSDSASSPSVCITPKEIFERAETLPVIQHLTVALQTFSSALFPGAALRSWAPHLAGTRDTHGSGQSIRAAGDEKAEPRRSLSISQEILVALLKGWPSVDRGTLKVVEGPDWHTSL